MGTKVGGVWDFGVVGLIADGTVVASLKISWDRRGGLPADAWPPFGWEGGDNNDGIAACCVPLVVVTGDAEFTVDGIPKGEPPGFDRGFSIG